MSPRRFSVGGVNIQAFPCQITWWWSYLGMSTAQMKEAVFWGELWWGMQTCRPSSSCAPSVHEYARDSQRWRTLWRQVRTSHLKMFGRNRSTGLLFKVFNKFPIKYGAFALFSTELLLFLQTTIGYSVMLFTQNFLHTDTESSYKLQFSQWVRQWFISCYEVFKSVKDLLDWFKPNSDLWFIH